MTATLCRYHFQRLFVSQEIPGFPKSDFEEGVWANIRASHHSYWPWHRLGSFGKLGCSTLEGCGYHAGTLITRIEQPSFAADENDVSKPKMMPKNLEILRERLEPR